MKKMFLLLVLVLFPIKVFAISAASAVAMDLNTGRLLYKNNINDIRLIASTTKIMTAIVAIENSNINETIIINEEVLKAYGSAIYIEVGEEIKLKDLLYGLLLRSGNDAAIAIANEVAGSMNDFADLMNITAAKIGMKNTRFYNSHGLEESDGTGNVSTAYDMALLTRYAMQNKTFKSIFGTKKYTVKTNYKTYVWTNKNKLLHSLDYITGGKTGFTKKARRTLVTTASNNNMEIVVVTLNDPNDFQDHKDIYNSIFETYESVLVLNKKNFKINQDTEYTKQLLYIKNNVYIPATKIEKKNINIKYELYKNYEYSNNEKVGVAKIYLKDKLIWEENIYTKKKDSPKLSWLAKIKRWLKW